MGILTRQFVDIIRWDDNSHNTIVHKVPIEVDQIQNGSTLIVQPGQSAILRVYDGSEDSSEPLNTVNDRYERNIVSSANGGNTQSAAKYVKGKTFASELFAEGTYEINTGVVPILSDLLGFKRGFQSNIKADVFFVTLKNFMGMKWGTPGGIQLIDVAFGDVNVQAYGTFSFRVKNPDMFIQCISGSDANFTVEDMERLDISDPTNAKNPIKSFVCGGFGEAVSEAYGNVIDITLLQGKKRAIAKLLKEIVNEQLDEFEFGLEINAINIESIHLPKMVQDRLNERTAVNVQGGFNAARSIAAMETMRNVGSNSSGGGMAGMFASAGMGASMGRQMGAAMNDGFSGEVASNLDAESRAMQQSRVNAYKNTPSKQETNFNEGEYKCACGYSSSNPYKFCPECGTKAPELKDSVPKFCPECGTKNENGSKFCQECGNKF